MKCNFPSFRDEKQFLALSSFGMLEEIQWHQVRHSKAYLAGFDGTFSFGYGLTESMLILAPMRNTEVLIVQKKVFHSFCYQI